MKLNIWQWLGVVLLIIAIWFWVNRMKRERKEAEVAKPLPALVLPDDATEDPTSAPAEPASAPATAPA